jgi:hypothetical protein
MALPWAKLKLSRLKPSDLGYKHTLTRAMCTKAFGSRKKSMRGAHATPGGASSPGLPPTHMPSATPPRSTPTSGQYGHAVWIGLVDRAPGGRQHVSLLMGGGGPEKDQGKFLRGPAPPPLTRLESIAHC